MFAIVHVSVRGVPSGGPTDRLQSFCAHVFVSLSGARTVRQSVVFLVLWLK